jgi:hypothetical protein
MATKGQTKNIAMNPVANKKIDENENFVPFQIDMRNLVRTDVGNRKKRAGYVQHADTGADYPIWALIDDGVGFSINTYGQVFRFDTNTELSGRRIDGFSRPTWDKFNENIVVCMGGRPTFIKDFRKISADTEAIFRGLPSADFISRLGDLVVLSTQGDTRFDWFDSSFLDGTGDITTEFANVRKDGTIQNQVELNERIYFFKEDTVEVRVNVGGSLVVRDELKIKKGLGARDSVVKANNTLYWWGNDKAFYVLNGTTEQDISTLQYKDVLKDLHSSDQIYGFDYRKDNVIKWFAPVEGRCFVYDYANNYFYEENRWQYASWQRIPVYSYMEKDNKQYFGSYEEDGLIHEWSQDETQDNGETIRAYARFAVRLSASGNRARINRLRFRFKSAVGAYAADEVFCYRYRLDRKGWSSERTVDLHNSGDIDHYHDEREIGIAKEIEVEVIDATDTEFLLTDIQMTVQELGN